MKEIFPISANISRSKTPFIIGNSAGGTFNKNSPKLNSTSSLFSSIDNTKESNLTSYYKEFFLNQVNIKLDERVYDLISKMDDIKQYNEAKEQYDEAKKMLIKEALNDKFNDYLKSNKNINRLNIKNYVDRINEKYSFDEKVNQLMFSLFTKLKTRKKKVFKYKIKNHLEKLFQGNVALYKKRKENHFEEKKKPEKKFDMKLLVKSNSDLAEYLRRKNKKKVMFEEKEKEKEEENTNKSNNNDENNKIQFKRNEKKKRTFLDKKTKIKEYFNNLNVVNNRRKSFLGEMNGFNNYNFISLNLQKESDKNNKLDSSLLNLPNINSKMKFNNSKYNSSFRKEFKGNKSSKKLKKINDNLILNNKDNKKEINPIDISVEKKDKNIQVIKKDKDIEVEKIDKNNSDKKRNYSILKNKKKDEDIKQKKSSKKIVEKDIKINQNLYLKINLNTKKSITRNRNNDNNKSQKNTYISEAANEILSELEKKEKKLTKSTSKLKKSLLYFRNMNENFKTLKGNKTSDFKFNYFSKSNKNNKILTMNNNIDNINKPNKKLALVFKQVNENNSQFHFPIINKLFYKDQKGKIDMIDRIKNNLKNVYSEKIKEQNNFIDKEMIGKEILNKLNDQYELEKLMEMAKDIREKRRKEANYEI